MKHFKTIALIAFALSASPLTQADALRDPTQPHSAPKAGPAAAAIAPLRVEAIFRSGAERSALVNGKLVRRGDRVQSALIEEVTVDGVRYLRGGRSEFTRLNSSKLHVRRSAPSAEEET